MAAEATVNFLIQRLNPFQCDVKELGLTAVHLGACSVRDELQRMSKFIRTADAMADANQSVRAWLERIREIALSLENLMNDFQLYLFDHPYLQHRRTVVTLLQKSRWIFRGQVYLSSSLIIPSHIEEAGDHVGTGKAKDKLVEWLLRGKPEFMRITVTGLGGMGKTTLVKQVYDTCIIKIHFDCHAWITVSRNFRIHSILQRMMEQFQPAFDKAARRWTQKELFKTQEVSDCS
ncbi:hypothetical protein ACLOJK_024429 [Asimina triloba]